MKVAGLFGDPIAVADAIAHCIERSGVQAMRVDAFLGPSDGGGNGCNTPFISPECDQLPTDKVASTVVMVE